MRKSFFALFCLLASLTAQETVPNIQEPFRPFSGKITGNKVRLRLQPSIESPVIKQLAQGELYIVLGEQDDFYCIAPPKETKAYVHRKFILDEAVEGVKVNVRLQPELDAPIVGQLNTGDKIKGTISAKNPKWLEINPPDTTRFYIAKEYIENLGGPEVLIRYQKKKEQINEQFQSSLSTLDNEMKKPFSEIQIDEALVKLQEIAKEGKEFPELSAKAKEIHAKASEEYLQKKIAFLENKSETTATVWIKKTEEAAPAPEVVAAPQKPPVPKTQEMQMWEPVELTLYEKWVNEREAYADFEAYVAAQEVGAHTIQGVIKPYNQKLKNRPGDYILVNEKTGVPLAYLYSTKVNLEETMGKKVALRVADRPNYNFAFPAYYVLSIGE